MCRFDRFPIREIASIALFVRASARVRNFSLLVADLARTRVFSTEPMIICTHICRFAQFIDAHSAIFQHIFIDYSPKNSPAGLPRRWSTAPCAAKSWPKSHVLIGLIGHHVGFAIDLGPRSVRGAISVHSYGEDKFRSLGTVIVHHMRQ